MRGKEEVFYNEGGKAPEQAVLRGSGWAIPANIQGQGGWSLEQPDLVQDVPADWRGVALNDF